MDGFDGDIGVQFTIHIANDYTVPELVELASQANQRGFDQIWVNDNLGYRNLFVVLTAIAQSVPIKLGTAIMVPYYRNPVDVADTVTALGEVMEDHELSIGLGRGSFVQTGNQVDTPYPYRMLRETAECLRSLTTGERISFGDYPLLTSYFNLQPKTDISLSFQSPAPIKFYMGGHGPTALTVGGKFMNGILFGGYFIPFIRAKKLGDRLTIAANAASKQSPHKRLYQIAEVNISVAKDEKAAREFPKPYIAHMILGLRRMGFTDEDFRSMNIDPYHLEKMEAEFEQGKDIHQVAKLVTDPMIEATFIAGNPSKCREKLLNIVEAAEYHGIDQIVFAKLGPDYQRAIDLLAKDVFPEVSS